MNQPSTEEVAPASGRLRLLRLEWPESVVGLTAFVGSALSPIGYDEAYWLAVARMVLNGRDLYVDALDNKTPLLHGLTWLLDLMPGPFALSRAVLVAALVMLVTRLLGRRPGQDSSPPTPLSRAAAGAFVMLVSQFHLTTELLALAAIAAAVSTARTGVASLLALLAAGFDPRSLLLLPAVALLRERRRAGMRSFLTLVGLGVFVALLTIWSFPDLRFGLLELSLSIRENEWSSMGVAALVYSLPLIALVGLGHRLVGSAAGLAWIVAAYSIPALSLIPFDHYWTYLAGVFVIAVRAPSGRVRPWVGTLVLLLSLLPLAARGYQEHRDNRALLADQLRAAEVLEENLDGGAFTYLGASPFLVMELTEQSLLRSPTAYYLIYDNPRSGIHRSELPALLEQAEAFVFDRRNGIIVADEQEIVTEFPCQVELEHTTVRFRDTDCMAP